MSLAGSMSDHICVQKKKDQRWVYTKPRQQGAATELVGWGMM
jgi:hypothetical protein